MEICYNNCIYNFEKNKGENKETFINRAWFLANLKPSPENFNSCLQKAELWSNIKFLNCKYDSNIHTSLNNDTNLEIYKI